MQSIRRNEVIPFAKMRDVQDNEPQRPELKCTVCRGAGVLPVIDAHGEQRDVARCPHCGGTRYEP
jgi:excinuclease UvrABC ATPase subunit